MSNVVQLRNPRTNLQMRRYWISFSESVIIGGESADESGVLTVGRDGLRAQLSVGGRELAQSIAHGTNIALWIGGAQVFIGVVAVEGERMLVSFGIPRGAKVSVAVAQDMQRDWETKTAVSANYR